MKRKRFDFYLGLFVMTGFIIAGFMIIKFGGMGTHERYDVYVVFDRVDTLIGDAPVYYAGVECGKVKRIIPWGTAVEGRPEIPRDKVKVVLYIDRTTTLRNRDEVKVTAVSLLGEKAIEIVPGPLESPALSKSGDALLVGRNPEGLFAPLREILGPLAEQETQENIREIFQSFSDLLDNLNRMTGDEFQLPLRDTVQNLSLAANDFRQVLSDFRAAVKTITGAGQEAQLLLAENREQIGGLIESMDQTLQSVDRVVDSAYPIIADIEAGKGGLGKFIKDPGWYTNFSKILTGLRTHGVVHLEDAWSDEQKEARRRPEPSVWVR